MKWLLEKIEDEDGLSCCHHEKAEQKKNWDHIVTVCQEAHDRRPRPRKVKAA